MNVVKALPALVVEEAEIHRFAAALDQVVARAQRVPSSFARFGAGVARSGTFRTRVAPRLSVSRAGDAHPGG